MDIWFDVLTLFYHTHYQSGTESLCQIVLYHNDIKSVISIRQRTSLRQSRYISTPMGAIDVLIIKQ